VTAPDVTLEARLEALEAMVAALAVEPLATVPPITIGELTNVPVPGSQLAAQWAQDVSSRIVQRFTTTAALKAWAAPTGAHAVALDSGVLWRRAAGGWSQVTPWTSNAAGIASIPPGLAGVVLAQIVIPADGAPRIATATATCRIDLITGHTASLFLSTPGTDYAQTLVTARDANDLPADPWYHTRHAVAHATNIAVPAGGLTLQSRLGADLGNTCQVYAGPQQNRLDVVVTPRGY
jgi:hypothetical protein